VASVLVTTDKDVEQAIDDMTRVLHIHKNTEINLDIEGLKEKLGIEPWQVVEMMALSGDSSDNIPGVPGIGPKTASKLIKKFNSVDELYDRLDEVKSDSIREKLEKNREQVNLSKKLVTLNMSVPMNIDLEACRTSDELPEKAVQFFKALGFRSLIDEKQQKDRTTSPGTGQQNLFDNEGPAEGPPMADTLDLDSVDVDYRIVQTEKDLDETLLALRKAERFAVDLETTSLDPHRAKMAGIALSWKEYQGVYIPTAAPEGEKTCDTDYVCQKLKTILEDTNLKKVGQNLKYDMSVLRAYGIMLGGISFDTMIASYLLHPSERSHSLDTLARRHLNYRPVPIKDIIGSGTMEVTIDTIPLDKVAPYACEDADLALRLTGKLQPLLKKHGLEKVYEDLELPLIEVLSSMEWQGIKIDQEELRRTSRSLEDSLKELQQKIYREAGTEFNINSPKQLSSVLFDRLGLPRPAGKKRTTGYSTDRSVLSKLAKEHQIARDLLRWRQLSKLKGTYTDALLEIVSPETGRLHTSFNQTGTATGRLSSSDPNLQNIPVRTPLGRQIRRAFVPGDQDMSLLSADYSQIELRILAHCSGDETLKEAFRNDRDIHSFVAAQINNIDEADVTPEMRQRAKAVNFGIVYGQTAYGLSKSIDISIDEAGEFINNYFKRYPKVKTFIEKTIETARNKGFVRTISGRQRPISGLRSSGTVQSAAERIAVNTVIQGSAADLIKKAMISLHRRLPEVSERSNILIQIHDELLLEVPDDEMDAVKKLVTREMTDVADLDVPLKVDVATGKNWEEAK
jgi:DNA polymerase-1